MKISDSEVLNLCAAFTQVTSEGSIDECLTQLSVLTARILSANGCTIFLLSEEEVAEAGLHDGAGFGPPPGRRGKSRKAELASPATAGKGVSIVRGGRSDMESMVSTIVLHGKIIGVVHACQPVQQSGFSKDDLDLFGVLTPLITKSIQVIQLQYILKSRFTQLALTKSNELTLHDLISGVRQNPNQIARILARSFYREMLNAGFSFNQIIFSVAEVISELSASLRRPAGNARQRSAQNDETCELLFQFSCDQPEKLSARSAIGAEDVIAV